MDENNKEKKEVKKKPKKISKKEEMLAKLKEDLNTQKDKFLRTAAEYENFRKRTEREKAAIYSDATAFTIETFLPVLDSLNLAIKASADAPEEYKKGLELMQNQALSSFEKLGIKEVGEKGDTFDPNYHNAVSHVDDENEDENVVIEVLQKGYAVKDKVIRPAMVRVAN